MILYMLVLLTPKLANYAGFFVVSILTLRATCSKKQEKSTRYSDMSMT